MSETVTTLQRAFGPILKPFAWAYGFGMAVRAGFYNRGLIPTWEPDALTISVGNIGWGGTGKTPMAGWLLDWSERHGLGAVLLTRGYRAKPVSYPYLVKPGALPEEAGDEPLMLAREHPKSHVIVDPDRTRGGKWAMKQFRPRMVILDDGFQHMAVKRHLNLTLLRVDDLGEDWNKVIPAGSWRETASALNRADAFMIKVGPKNFKRIRPNIEQRLGPFRKPVFTFQVVPTGLRNVLHGNVTVDFNRANYLLVTGVGDPKLVQQTAKNYLGYAPIKHITYRDHHVYTKQDVMEMQAVAHKLGCEAILCTPKDAVKLGPMCTDDFWQFDLRIDFGPSTIGSETTFERWWNRRWDSLNLKRADNKAGTSAPEDTPPAPEATPDKGQEKPNG